MEKKKTCGCCRTKKTEKLNPADEYSGVAANEADDGKVTTKLEKERTRTLNNNPRNDEGGEL